MFGLPGAAAEEVFENAPATRTEDFAEKVERIVETSATTRTGPLESGVAETVVGGALLGIDENVISLRDFFEMLLGLAVARIAVRVVFHGQLPVGAFDFLGRGPAGDAEDLVGIPAMTRRHDGGQEAGPLETNTLAGRSKRSRNL